MHGTDVVVENLWISSGSSIKFRKYGGHSIEKPKPLSKAFFVDKSEDDLKKANFEISGTFTPYVAGTPISYIMGGTDFVEWTQDDSDGVRCQMGHNRAPTSRSIGIPPGVYVMVWGDKDDFSCSTTNAR